MRVRLPPRGFAECSQVYMQNRCLKWRESSSLSMELRFHVAELVDALVKMT